ncbi:penicillin-binding protein 1A [Azospirillum lipoferum]|uniref:Penicillin-binding protein 1A n=1 Tax=Azospirillum lipoferum TaxID=193 RepID=A0A5A9G2A8_AZOLI|nr:MULTISPECIES: penicillin-binding protein 1A [Azospirillum]KAA0587985.1 penicillin-binding protein 1A [Azospirillum lipoferum]MCP1612171.1 penicillin-binding protein 1A [Azospirillum lipoferum]MDW5536607.1 penicillin-binding protein 1A [Azospirillum sp. NL1]
MTADRPDHQTDRRAGQLYAGPRPIRTREDPSPLDRLTAGDAARALAAKAIEFARDRLATAGKGKPRRRPPPPSAAPTPTPFKQPRRPRRGLPAFTLPSFTLPSISLSRVSLPKLKPPARRSGGSQPPQPPSPPPARPGRAPQPPRKGGGWVKRLVQWGLVAAIWCGIALGAVLAWFALDLPDISKVAQFERRASITVLAADGSEFARFGDLHGTTLSVRDLPPHLVGAVLAIEDRRFYSHFGIDPLGLARAVYVNWRSGRAVQGGSTITQQLAKNLFLTPEKSLKRKIQEAMLALWLESRFTKDQILTAYLNRVYLGAGTFGVDAAARTYFGKPATEVDVRESAVLAGLLKAPSRYAPSSNPDESAERARVVMAAMLDAGYLTQAQYDAARTAKPSPKRKPGGDGRYFADWVTDLVPGFTGPDHGDVIVRTTLDLKMQRAAEQRLEALLAGPGVAANVRQGALVAMSPDGAVRALVGGRDYDSSEFNRATQALRQPGSAFKPFVYLAALETGWTPDSLIDDAPVQLGNWSPGNYDGKYRGSITLAAALAHSSNTATARLIDRVGTDRVRRIASNLGISSPLTRDLSLGLGTSEVTPLELVRAYAGIANRGVPVWAYAITEIRSRDGAVLYRRQGGGGAAVVDPAHAVQLSQMMTGVLDYGTGRSAKLNRPAAAKSGTTQDYHDAWFVGFTADLVAGVWLGNDNNEAMKKVTGGTLPAKLWREFMLDAHAGKPARPLPGLDGAPAWTPPPGNMPPGSVMPGAMPPGGVPMASADARSGGGIGSLIEKIAGGSGTAPRVQSDYSHSGVR